MFLIRKLTSGTETGEARRVLFRPLKKFSRRRRSRSVRAAGAHLDGCKALTVGRCGRLDALEKRLHVAVAGGLALVVERPRDDQVVRLLPAGRTLLCVLQLTMLCAAGSFCQTQ